MREGEWFQTSHKSWAWRLILELEIEKTDKSKPDSRSTYWPFPWPFKHGLYEWMEFAQLSLRWICWHIGPVAVFLLLEQQLNVYVNRCISMKTDHTSPTDDDHIIRYMGLVVLYMQIFPLLQELLLSSERGGSLLSQLSLCFVLITDSFYKSERSHSR